MGKNFYYMYKNSLNDRVKNTVLLKDHKLLMKLDAYNQEEPGTGHGFTYTLVSLIWDGYNH